MNNDINSNQTLHKTLSCDLLQDCLYRDFCCNCLYYDFVNGVIMDPTGYGVTDAKSKLLRIPVDNSMWEIWFKGNTFKLLRYWKFVIKGYCSFDQSTQKYIKDQFEIILPYLNINQVKTFIYLGVQNRKNSETSKKKQYLQAIQSSIQQTWYDTYLKPLE